MRKLVSASALIAMVAGSAMANGNSGAATGMAGVLSGTPGIGSIAPSVSGKDARGDSGWGNVAGVSRGKD